MTRASQRRITARRARYANRYGIRACGRGAGRWIHRGYRLDMTWAYIRKQARRG